MRVEKSPRERVKYVRVTIAHAMKINNRDNTFWCLIILSNRFFDKHLHDGFLTHNTRLMEKF